MKLQCLYQRDGETESLGVLFCAAFMDKIYERLDVVDWRLRQNTVSQIEDVTRPPSCSLQNAAGAF